MLPLKYTSVNALIGFCVSRLTLSNSFLSSFRFSSHHIVLHCPAGIYTQHLYTMKGTVLPR